MDYHVVWHLLLIVVCLATASDHAVGPNEEALDRHPRLTGADAKEPYPFVVSLRNKKKEAFCVGTIIPGRWTAGGPNNESSDVVITAAQCVCESAGKPLPVEKVREWTVVHGGNQGTKFYTGGILNKVKNITCHPDFNKNGTFDDDIAVLFMEKPFIFAQGPKAIEIIWYHASMLDEIPRSPCRMVGWGEKMFQNRTHILFSPVDKMQEIYGVIKVTERDCVAFFKRKRSEFCYSGGSAAACLGDMGAPIFCDLPSSGRKLVAFHSKLLPKSINGQLGSNMERDPSLPCYYNRLTIGTRLTYYMFWVDEQVNPWDPSWGPENRRRMRLSKERPPKPQPGLQKSPKPGGPKSSVKPKKG